MKTLENVDLKRVMGHWECYVDGQFVCSGDTLDEVLEELELYMKEDWI